MKFTVKVENGVVNKVNGTNYLSDLAKSMALELLGEKRFPSWDTIAHKTLCAITGAGAFAQLVDTSTPATRQHVFDTISVLQAVFIRFKDEYYIPAVLEDGDYSLTDVTIVAIGKTKRR